MPKINKKLTNEELTVMLSESIIDLEKLKSAMPELTDKMLKQVCKITIIRLAWMITDIKDELAARGLNICNVGVYDGEETKPS